MWLFIRCAILPGLLILGGLASLIYGARFHYLPVITKEAAKKNIDIPAALSQIPQPFSGAQGFGAPAQTQKQTVRSMEVVLIKISEPALIRDVTVGGVALNKSDKLERTYSGKAPSLCPT